ncbi:MAG: archease [Proteobacteria bacterium]|nr:archease [Pseudomonadota bacterium]
MKYKTIDHTADIGIEVFGFKLEDLFENAAFAMYDLLTDTGTLLSLSETSITVTGQDWPDLMVNWLRELLYLFTGKAMLVKSTKIISLSEFTITANIKYEDFVSGCHIIKNEIKAVTYHQIKVEPAGSKWKARIIFDV